MSESINLNSMPTSWEVVPLGKFVKSEKGKKPKKESKIKTEECQIPYVDIEAFEQGNIKSWTNGEGCRLCYENDFLIVWDGSRSGLVGKGMNGALGSTLVRINFPNMHNPYAFYFMQSKYLEINSRAKGSGTPHVDPDLLWNYSFPIPPLNEQKRIVEKIDELFSELDKGAESLKTAREQLKIYRQSVLKHAFEGKLTENWRTENQSSKLKIETFSLKNKKAFSVDEIEDLPSIPNCWEYIRLENLGNLGRGKSKHRPRNDDRLFGGKYPFIQTGEIKAANRFVKTYSQTYSDFGLAQSKLWPSGTLCITIAANIAETAFLSFDACFPDSVVGFTPDNSVILPQYLEFFLASVRNRIEAYAPATAQKNINLNTLENLIIPICSLDEQKILVTLLEKIDETIQNSNLEVDCQLQKSEALRQSILKSAFSGKLVAQAPKDEPASVLLERIKSEQSKPIKQKFATPKKKPKPRHEAEIIPFPSPVSSISTTDLHAGIIALAYSEHEKYPKQLNTFGHVKAEKIAHLVEYSLGIPLGRNPVKDAAGPNDYNHLKKIEHRANMVNWFSVSRRDGGQGYYFTKKYGFGKLITKTETALGEKYSEVTNLISLMLPLNTQQAEIVATLFAAWNNLILIGEATPNDEAIVTEARENWHASKLSIERERFFSALSWLRKKNLIPRGIGKVVGGHEVTHD